MSEKNPIIVENLSGGMKHEYNGRNMIYEFPSLSGEPFFGMPGLVADSLPDDFGNKVIEQWLVSQGKTLKDFTAIDRLCYTGKRGMGALEYVPEYTLIEYAYYKMALAAGIDMSECRIYSCAGENHFMTKRFDRVSGKKIHMQPLGAMAHISYKEPGLCSYEMAAQYMQQLHFLTIRQTNGSGHIR